MSTKMSKRWIHSSYRKRLKELKRSLKIEAIWDKVGYLVAAIRTRKDCIFGNEACSGPKTLTAEHKNSVYLVEYYA